VLDPAKQRVGDTKEGFYIGREVAAGSQEAALPLHGPNVWPPEALLPGFRATMEAYFQTCWATGDRLTALLGASLSLPDGFFAQPGRFDRPQLFLRLLRYTDQLSDPAAGVFGAGAHSDYGMLTLLATDDEPGLEIQWPRGTGEECWVAVPPRPGCFIVNLGDLLERWTNGLYRSTRHRVLNRTGRPRYSIPFFYEPNHGCLVECLPQCLAPGEKPKHAPITAGAYLQWRYSQTHADYGGKPALA